MRAIITALALVISAQAQETRDVASESIPNRVDVRSIAPAALENMLTGLSLICGIGPISIAETGAS
jgi:hypothetical protein